jgi:hypothetical protein
VAAWWPLLAWAALLLAAPVLGALEVAAVAA